MEVPATRPEVTTTGIYGDELHGIRQRLLRSQFCWCGDLTSRTQVLIVGFAASSASCKLSVARAREIPCVSVSWVTDGACSLQSVEKYDIGHSLTEKQVCTTSLHHLERERVHAVCRARRATYNTLLTRDCGLLVAASAALGCTSSPSIASPVVGVSAKIRFARRHRIPILTLDDFLHRYASGLTISRQVTRASAALEGTEDDVLTLKPAHKCTINSSGSTHVMAAEESNTEVGFNTNAASAYSSSFLGCSEVMARSTANLPALPVSSGSLTPPRGLCDIRNTSNVGELWQESDSALTTAVQPSLPSQLVPASLRITCASSPARSVWRPLTDEFSDVVAYVSPPYRRLAQHYDLLCGMGVIVTPWLTSSTTHVLILGDTVEECLYPRPGLQIVSWNWVAQCRLEQRRLSCLGFRVECSFRPVVTFTGLSPAERRTLLSKLRCSDLTIEVQEALVLGSCRPGVSAGHVPHETPSSRRSASFPRNTTHLVVPRDRLLTSQKVAVLSQHFHQQAFRHRQPPSLVFLSTTTTCALIAMEWIERSIEQRRWLDEEMFVLDIPTSKTFALAAACHASVGRTVVSGGSGGSHLSQDGLTTQSSTLQVTMNNTMRATSVVQPATSTSKPASQHEVRNTAVDESSATHSGVELDEEEAALSQKRTMVHGCLSESTPISTRHCAKDDDDEEAGGESPSAAAAARTVLQAMHSAFPQTSPPESQPVRWARALSSERRNDIEADGKDTFTMASYNRTDLGAPSSTHLTTQYSPDFENFLCELEAGPASALHGACTSQASSQLPPQDVTALLVGSNIPRADNREPQRGDPLPQHSSGTAPQPTSGNLWIGSRALLHRLSTHRTMAQPHKRQQLSNRTMSDESQVIVYQTGRGAENGLMGMSQVPKPQNFMETSCCCDGVLGEAQSIAADLRPDAPPQVYLHSKVSNAVLLITKDLLKSQWDGETFAAHFSQLQRTNKPDECTHFITEKPSKTEQFLCCLAAGRWILTSAYVIACARAGYLVEETPFEWNAEVATTLGCRSSVASLVRGCRMQREASTRPFTSWRVRVCCTSAARAASFFRVLHSGGCTSMEAATATDVMATSGAPTTPSPSVTELVLADDDVFTGDELERYATSPRSKTCPILRMEYLVQFLCAPDMSRSDMSLLSYVRVRKRSRTEA